MLTIEDLIGKRFGHLVVLSRATNTNSGSVRWLCQCDCGKQTITRKYKLLSGSTTSCGCQHGHHIRHGMAGTKVYTAWLNMMNRVKGVGAKAKEYYLGKRHLDPVFKSFEAFYKEVGDPPTSKHEIDRIDNEGHYVRGNLRWATREEQMRNTRLAKACKRGHPWTAESTYTDGRGYRNCKICARLRRSH